MLSAMQILMKNPSTQTWNLDLDGDGFGDPNATISACEMGESMVNDNTDCSVEIQTFLQVAVANR